jgi:hypothetical protein
MVERDMAELAGKCGRIFLFEDRKNLFWHELALKTAFWSGASACGSGSNFS